MINTIALLATFMASLLLANILSPLNAATNAIETTQVQSVSPFTSFTGKIIGDNVRMRNSADLDGAIISVLSKGDYIVVLGEKEGFYAVKAPEELKAYIFRGFVIDDVVEGKQVNIRLWPDKEAPIIGHYSTGQHIDGTICKDHKKWLQIPAPKDIQFYIAKEFVEYAGKADLKSIYDKRKKDVMQLFEATSLLAQSELQKNFHEIGIERVQQGFQTIVKEYADFPDIVSKAENALIRTQEQYLCRKIAFLENKISQKVEGGQIKDSVHDVDVAISSVERMKVWEPIEQAYYLKWSKMYHAKTIDDFYHDQKMKCQHIAGILESYKEPVHNKPGDFVIKNQDGIIIAYVYSTHVNLQESEGKRVHLMVASRPNNDFAFPAYYVLDLE